LSSIIPRLHELLWNEFAESNVLSADLGRAIAQAVSRWLPTVAARVRARVWSSGICGGQNGAGANSKNRVLSDGPKTQNGNFLENDS
jgi:hypothetical protein